MAQNPHVKNVRKALKNAGIDFTYLEYGSYFSQWRKRLAIKMWSGWPTFPRLRARSPPRRGGPHGGPRSPTVASALAYEA